jgi:hypothetical protein
VATPLCMTRSMLQEDVEAEDFAPNQPAASSIPDHYSAYQGQNGHAPHAAAPAVAAAPPAPPGTSNASAMDPAAAGAAAAAAVRVSGLQAASIATCCSHGACLLTQKLERPG